MGLYIINFANARGGSVAAVALDGASNTGILAAQILATNDKEIYEKIIKYKEGLKSKVFNSNKDL